MDIKNMSVNRYISILSTKEPVPGGGAASAISGAQAMALTLMVADLTVGKKRYEEFENLCADAIKEGSEIRDCLLSLADKDAEVYGKLNSAFKLPKETDEEKAARSKAIGSAAVEAAAVPLEIMRAGKKVLDITLRLTGNSNPNAASDLGVAAMCALAAVKGGWLNVKVNLPLIKDIDCAETMKKEGLELINESEKTALQIYDAVI